MKDVRMRYENAEGKMVEKEYDTIMDFIDEMEQKRTDAPSPDYKMYGFVLFENPYNCGSFETVGDFLNHCRQIVK